MTNITITQNGANSQVNVNMNNTICNKIIIDISDKEFIECSLGNQDVDINWHDLSLEEKERIVNALTTVTNMFQTSYNKIKQNNDKDNESI